MRRLPFNTSTSVEASLQMLCGGRQSTRFTSAMVPEQDVTEMHWSKNIAHQ
jgi:hypothetical protein